MKPIIFTRLLSICLFVIAFFTENIIEAQVETTYLEEWYASDGSQTEATDRVVSLPDIDGNLYVTGTTLNQYGKQDLLLTKYNSTGDEIWSETFNITDTNSNVVIGDIIMNGDDDLYITGTVYNGATQDYDALTVKYDSSGVFKWHKLYDGAGSIYDGGADVMYDQYNRIFVTGSTTNSSGDQDMLTICYSTSGTQLWVNTYDGYSLTDVGARINSFTFAGQVHIRGFSQKTSTSWVVTYITYNSSTGSVVGTPTQSADVYIDEIRDVTIDDSQNIYFAGVSDDQGNGNDFMIVKVSSGMGIAWTKYYDGADHLDDVAHGIIVDNSSGKVYVTGYSKTSTGGRDLVVLKYSATGTLEWSEIYDGAAGEDDEGLDIKVDNSGQVVVAGYSTEENTKDYYTLILNSSGNEVWSASFNGVENQDDQVQNLLLDGSGNITIVGHTGTKDGKTTYTTVRYNKKDLFIPPDSEAVSSGIGYCENKGQLIKTDSTAAPEIEFYCTGQSPALYFQDNRVSFVLAHVDTSASTQDTMYRVDMTFNKSKGNERIYGLSERLDHHNYYLGHIPTGREKVRLYDRLVQTDVFEDIDFQYYSNGGGVKYYFVCKPGANPKDIELVIDDHQGLSVNGNGDLVIKTTLEDIILPQPSVSQFTANGTETTLAWTPSYSVVNDTVSLSYGAYDSGKYLVFRVKETVPTVPPADDDWVTYFGGTGSDGVTDLVVDNTENIYITGYTTSLDFPPAGENTIIGLTDVFFTLFNEQTELIWTTIVGGFSGDQGYAIDISQGSVPFLAIGGQSSSSFFPNAGAAPTPTTANLYNNGIIILASASSGEILDAQYIGGADFDLLSDVVIDANEKIYVSGWLESSISTLGINSNTYVQSSLSGDRDGFIERFNSSLTTEWRTYFGGKGLEAIYKMKINPSTNNLVVVGATSSEDAATQDSNNTLCGVPADGSFPNCVLSGAYNQLWGGGDPDNVRDLFIAEFGNSGNLLWSSYLGGSGDEKFQGTRLGPSIDISSDGEIIALSGVTSDNQAFPHDAPPEVGEYFDNTNKSRASFVVKFVDREMEWSSAFGNKNDLFHTSVSIDASNRLLLTGATSEETPAASNEYCVVPSQGFPICLGNSTLFFQEGTTPTFGGVLDAFIAGFGVDNNLLWSTYFGGVNSEAIYSITVGESNNYLYLGGVTLSPENFPLRDPQNGGFFESNLKGIEDGVVGRLNIENVAVFQKETLEEEVSVSLVYPNPTSGFITIKIPESTSSLSLLNMDGKVLLQRETSFLNEGSLNLDITNFPSGPYIIRLLSENKLYQNIVILK